MSAQRVLVIDDEAAFGKFVGKVISNCGHDVKVVSSAKECMDVFGSFDPEIVFLDMFMPDMDGFELADWIFEQSYRGKLVFMSGTDARFPVMAGRLAEARTNADIMTVTKPLRADEIREIIA
jgi:CheY-like chemotaxis protein